MHREELWYVSYGSNMCRGRFECYLRGGRPAGASRTYAGARDPSVPADDRAVELPGSVYFAGESAVWGGGIAFYDHDVPGPTPARAYRVTAGQLADVAAQEMHRIPVAGDPLEEMLLDGLPDGLADGRHHAGPGHYETLVEVGGLDGLPMITFTAPHGLASVPHAVPAPAYLAMLAQGLREAHGWADEQVAAHLARVSPR